MFADPRLMEAETIEPLHELEIAVHAGRAGFSSIGWKGRQEDAVARSWIWVMAGLSGTAVRHCARQAVAPQADLCSASEPAVTVR